MTTPNLPPLPEPSTPAGEPEPLRWLVSLRGAPLDGAAVWSRQPTSEEMGTWPGESVVTPLYALEALRLASPQGWKLVPIEPTKEMIRAAVEANEGPAVYKVMSAGGLSTLEAEVLEGWAAMLAAAPEATKGNGG